MLLEPRKHPRQRRSVITVDSILEAAACVLESGGLDSLNTNVVAEHAGVSIGSLYQYFSGKEAILAELIRRERLLLLTEIDRIVGTPGNSLQADIFMLIQAAVGHQLQRPELAQTLEYVEAMLPFGPETAIVTNSIVQYVAKILERYQIEEKQEKSQDLVALAKGMIDAAGVSGEKDRHNLVGRVCRACYGYLELQRVSGNPLAPA